MKYIKIAKVVVLFSALGMLMSGCATDVVGRYNTCENQKGQDCSAQIPTATASVVFLPAVQSTSSARNGTDLPAVAQAAYINFLAKQGSTAEELRKNLAAKIASGEGSPKLRDKTVFGGTLIITVSDTGPFNPSDRLVRTEVKIEFDDFKIHSWTAVKTVNTTVNAGTIKSNRVQGMEFGITSPALPEIPGISVKANTQSTLDETLNASERVEDVTPIFYPECGTITIIRHGGIGLNLTGNTLLEVTFVPKEPDTAFEELFSITTTDKNEWIEPTKLKLISQTSKVPRGKTLDGSGTVTLTYTLRHVKNGGKTIPDVDDDVKLITKTIPAKQILIPAEYFQVETFGLQLEDDSSNKSDGPWIAVRRPQRPKDTALCFDNYESAQDFLDYLRRPTNSVNLETVGTAQIGIVDRVTLNFSLDAKQVRKLSVQPKCQPI